MLSDVVHPLIVTKEKYSIEKALGFRFKCLNCSECCRVLRVRVTDPEIKAIRKYLGKKVKIKDNLIQPPCPFLRGNMCSIYPVRPLVCKLFPTTMKNGRLALQLDCAGVKKVMGDKVWL